MFGIWKTYKRLIFLTTVIIFFILIFSLSYIYAPDEIQYGITFSAKQAKDLGLNWQETYLAILDDLGVRRLRLAAYWDEIEPSPGKFVWDELDWQIKEANKRQASIILAVGARLPRWPECHIPDWAQNLPKEKREQEILIYLRNVIERYKNNKNIIAWQVENEPFLVNFGECPEFDKKFLDQEIALVKNLDSRPVIITDSGELSTWVPAAKRADIFGTTMYRDTYSRHLRMYIHYPIEPGFFRFKRNITRLFAYPQDWVVIELQAEPWGPVPFQYLSSAERTKTMNLEKFREIIDFSRQTGFREFYLWGAEWWYWEKNKQNNPELWEEAKKLFKN